MRVYIFKCIDENKSAGIARRADSPEAFDDTLPPSRCLRRFATLHAICAIFPPCHQNPRHANWQSFSRPSHGALRDCSVFICQLQTAASLAWPQKTRKDIEFRTAGDVKSIAKIAAKCIFQRFPGYQTVIRCPQTTALKQRVTRISAAYMRRCGFGSKLHGLPRLDGM